MTAPQQQNDPSSPSPESDRASQRAPSIFGWSFGRKDSGDLQPIQLRDSSPTSPTSPSKAHHISLNDRTISQDLLSTPAREPSVAERSDSEILGSAASSEEPLIRKPTGSSLRDNLQQQINRQKFAKYQSHRYEQNKQDLALAEHSSAPQGVLERSRARAAGLLNKKRTLRKADDRDAVLDILYENQRGSFFCGIPRYSSNSLLQFDPRPWQNADFRTSAVDIRNAQVPDPSWQWAWKSWYVDMSRDVDEEGWEYSFAFSPQFAWHGNHPWFHSFVRRRRWLRRRVRKDTAHKTKERAHELAPDYFTIHTKVLSAGSQTEHSWDPLRNPDDEKFEDVDVPDILALTRIMSKARIDREKLLAVRKFVQQGGEDLHYLANRMPEIMSLFIYQSSRRQLLAELIHHHDAVSKRRSSLSKHTHDDDDKTKQSHDAETRKADNLLNAIDAAEAQVLKLEYWSDIKEMAQDGQTIGSGHWDKGRWQDVSTHYTNAFLSKQAAHAPAAKLHDEPEERAKPGKDSSRETSKDKYITAPSTARPSIAEPSSGASPSDDTDNALERFVTASEGPVSSIKPRQYRDKNFRGQAREQLDGVDEE
ncbi:hypothetical protein AMS68_000145 [Peltaster fructicola]|uniref:Peroxin/Ferlin domain-containing protein n=1 Tax=Peltaster fructicola TaxID=286661 RepID=A0A6H0XJ06_9PEZI|nr:hypothetical protein AMS68_000145 [Peltaster fructicola]